MITRRALTAFAGAMLVAATSAGAMVADSHTEPDGITGIDWALTSITLDGSTIVVPGEIGASLVLGDDASGSAGCNDFFGSYLLDGSDLTFGPLAATKKLCQGIEQEVEDAYLPALALVTSWALNDDGSLSLFDSDGAEILSYVSGESGIEGINWLLREQVGDGAMAAVPDGVIVSLRLEDGTASGTGGCNRYSGSYVLEGSSLTFGPVASTLMACVGPAGEVESTYLSNMGAVATWESGDDTLTLSDAGGNAILRYEAQAEATVVGDWAATGINNGNEAVVSSASTELVNATFGADGSLTGFDGCNDYFGDYQIDGDSIAIGPLGTTRKACPDDEIAAMSVEYQAALANASTWAVTDTGSLELRDGEGALQVGYVPAEG